MGDQPGISSGMSQQKRISLIDPEDASGDTKVLFDAVEAMLGRVPAPYQTMAHSPLVAKMMVPFNAVLQRQGAGSVLDTRLKEMVVIKTSHINGCNYLTAHNTSLGQAAGITWQQIDAIGSDDYMDSDVLNDREKVAILWAEHVTLNTARSRDDVYDQVAAEFNEAEIVELTLMSCFFNLFNRFVDSLRVPIEVSTEIDKIKSSLHLDPDKVKDYYQTVVDTWPGSFPDPTKG